LAVDGPRELLRRHAESPRPSGKAYRLVAWGKPEEALRAQ
jgi:hypothetical protein